MSTQARMFAKANTDKGLSTEQLQALHGIGSHEAQSALDFVLPLLSSNESADVLEVMQRAKAAFDGPDGIDGVAEVMSAAGVSGFPQTTAPATRWVLDACIYAAQHYNTSAEEVEAPIPVLS